MSSINEQLKAAMASLAASDEAPPLAPSKLGTKEHWDQVYEREVKTFAEIGDEGEVWFGEDAAEAMVDWIEDNMNTKDQTILDIGTGNGQLLFALSLASYTNLTGIDYSPASVTLAQNIAAARAASGELPAAPRFAVADVFSPADDDAAGVKGRKWDLVTDKGTYDAISLSDEKLGDGRALREGYPAKVAGLLKEEGGVFLITSCNWTRAELEKAFITPETGLVYHSHIPRPSFTFGGATGSTITTVAFTLKPQA